MDHLDKAGILRFSFPMLFSAVMLIASGMMASVVAELTARGILGPNGGAGIRIASTMQSKSAWKIGHRAARPWLHAGSAALVSSGALTIAVVTPIVDAVLPIGMALALCLLIVSAVVADRAVRRSEATTRDD